MRYKEQTLKQIERVDNLIKVIETHINRNETRQTVLHVVNELKEQVEKVRSLVSIEHDNFLNQR